MPMVGGGRAWSEEGGERSGGGVFRVFVAKGVNGVWPLYVTRGRCVLHIWCETKEVIDFFGDCLQFVFLGAM